MTSDRGVILHVRESNVWGSPERLILGQIRFLGKYAGVPVTYRRRGHSNPFAENLGREGIAFAELDEWGPGDPRTVYRLAALIRKRGAALIVTHDFKSNLYGYLASKLTGCPQIVHFHGFTAEGVKVRLYNAIDRAVMRRCRAIITVAEQTKELLISLGVRGDKIEVVINAVAPEAFERVAGDSIEFDRDRKLIVAAGRLSHEKGVDLLVHAARLLKDQGQSFCIQAYGDGPERKSLEGLIASLDIADCVRLAGFRHDLRPVYAQAEFLVIPSRSEAFPLVLLEAWAQGTPVVATPVGRLTELIQNGITGLLARASTAEALAEAMTNALHMPDFRSRCGAAGRELARQKFCFSAQVGALTEVYDRHIGQMR